MNREIKFRKWGIYIDGKLRMVDWTILKSTPLFAFRTDVGEVFMQYTGLKDKNGKEIYESDIIAIKGTPNKFYQVVFSRASFVLKEIIKDNDIRIPMQDEYGMIIIGNVYENPELIK